ncbi:MAG TPA: serine/threonine-protein kinase [Pyrinomonadaceae bacterium]|nr:serine/threonine-protein kinase [Pyrinomonadaceae bacterium]
MTDDQKPPTGRPPRRDPYRLTGEVFGGRYRLEEFAGMGSFGAVYRATDARVGRTVAVKILKPDLGDDEMNDARELFQREALTAGRLMHPHIVAVTDVGEDAGFAYLVMEWLEGSTLEDELRARVPFSPEETSSLLGTIADALAAAHNAGVIHRDIKPSNIHLGRRERPFVKVLDFGIAKVVTSSTAVAASRIAGTVSYMSPEQITGSRIDRRTDIYSLGIVLYQMLTGELPFKGDSQGHIIQQHIAVNPPSLSEACPDISPELSHVIQRALGKLPEARQQSAQELHSEFVAALARKAFQPADSTTRTQEEVTEVLPSSLRPTAISPPPIEPQPGVDIAGPQRGLLSEPTHERGAGQTPPKVIGGTVPEPSPQPVSVTERKPRKMLFWAAAGGMVGLLLGLYVQGRIEEALGYYLPQSYRFGALATTLFGLFLGVVLSTINNTRRLVRYALGGAVAFLLLSFILPNLLWPNVGFLRREPLTYLYLPNMVLGALMGAAVCCLKWPVVPARRLPAYLSHGAAYALLVMSAYYELMGGLRLSPDNIRYIVEMLWVRATFWIVLGLLSFVVGLIVGAVRFRYRKKREIMWAGAEPK